MYMYMYARVCIYTISIHVHVMCHTQHNMQQKHFLVNDGYTRVCAVCVCCVCVCVCVCVCFSQRGGVCTGVGSGETVSFDVSVAVTECTPELMAGPKE